ncbi:hypothetical protein BHM03_00061550, partial [Ensete ventricosum]
VGVADLTCARSAVRHLVSFDQSYWFGHVSGLAVRERDDLAARSASYKLMTGSSNRYLVVPLIVSQSLGRYFTAFLAYGGINLILAAAAAALCAYVAPAAAGSGIPEVKAYLNGVDAYSILAPSTLFVKVVGTWTARYPTVP